MELSKSKMSEFKKTRYLVIKYFWAVLLPAEKPRLDWFLMINRFLCFFCNFLNREIELSVEALSTMTI